MKNSQRMLLLGSIVLLQPMAACASEDVLKQKDDWIEVEKPIPLPLSKRETSEERGRRIWREINLWRNLWHWQTQQKRLEDEIKTMQDPTQQAQAQKELRDTYSLQRLIQEKERSNKEADYWYNTFYASKESKPIDQD